jgi:predicted MFS family arabinose efflux permease
MLVWSTALYSVYTYLGTGLAGLGYSTEQTARAILFYGIGAIAGTLLGGRLADRWGARLTMLVSLAGLAVAFLALRPTLGAGISADITLGVLSALAQLFFPAQQAGLAADFPAQRATALAWNNSGLFFGISLGSLVGAQVIGFAGFGSLTTVAAVIAAGGWLVIRAVMPESRAVRARPAA